MEKNTENQTETGVIRGLYRDPGIQIIPTLGPEIYNPTYMGLFGSLG